MEATGQLKYNTGSIEKTVLKRLTLWEIFLFWIYDLGD